MFVLPFHLIKVNAAAPVDIIHLEGPGQLLLRTPIAGHMERQHELSEVYCSAPVGVYKQNIGHLQRHLNLRKGRTETYFGRLFGLIVWPNIRPKYFRHDFEILSMLPNIRYQPNMVLLNDGGPPKVYAGILCCLNRL